MKTLDAELQAWLDADPVGREWCISRDERGYLVTMTDLKRNKDLETIRTCAATIADAVSKALDQEASES